MIQNLFILGASGNVGRELIKQVQLFDGIKDNVNPSNIVGVANSNNYIFNSRGIESNILSDISSNRDKSLEVLSKLGEEVKDLNSFLGLVKSEGLESDVIFVDVTAGKDDLKQFHMDILTKSGNSLVTANKNPISLYSLEDFNILTSEYGRYDTNTTVMGGAGILNFIDSRAKINDNINMLSGVLSGTLGYILSELQKGEKTFSQIVSDAKDEGYTEPNPWDDLNGLDVARKLVILARYAGHEVDIDDVKVTPLIDEKYGKIDSDKFMKAIENEDDKFENIVTVGKNNGEVPRYVGKMIYDKTSGKLELTVKLELVPLNSDLGNLGGTSNLVTVKTEILSNPYPHIIKSRGAGLGVTAGAVRAGIANMLPQGLSRR